MLYPSYSGLQLGTSEKRIYTEFAEVLDGYILRNLSCKLKLSKYIMLFNMKQKIKVGFDFDGVVVYNPFRVLRSIVVGIKRHIFKINEVRFYYPKTKWQRLFWIILHESSIFPSPGAELIKKLVSEKKIEAHLITGRFSFLDQKLNKWLKKHHLHNCFKTVNMNQYNKQPHLFKEEMLKKYHLDFYIEDNWDIVNYLNSKKTAKIYWIYNILDKRINYKHKFPYLRKALEEISKKLG